MIKRITVFLLSLIIVSSSFVVFYKDRVVAQNNQLDNYLKAEKAVLEAWYYLEDVVDVQEFEIPRSEYLKFINYVSNRNPEYFYGDFRSYRYNPENDMITKFELKYIHDKDKVPSMIEELEVKTKEILGEMPQSVSKEEQLLFLHDYIANHTTYDLRVFQGIDTSSDKYIRNAYGCLVNRIAVCEGITEAFVYLCKKIDIEAFVVTSTSLRHEWNMVQLGENYYHIDITQDAPVYNLGEHGFHQAFGDVTHKFFLKSDDEIKSAELGNSVHYSWDAPYKATDSTTYKKSFWNSSHGILNYHEGYYYYISNGNFVKYDYNNKELKSIFSIDEDLWYCTCGSIHRWRGEYSRAVLDEPNNQIYFLATNNVYAYNLDNGSISLIYAYRGKGFIYSIMYEYEHLHISLRDDDKKYHPFYTDKIIYMERFLDSSLIMGDANNDSHINVTDVLAMKKHLAKDEFEIDMNTSDVCFDGTVNTKDVLYLTKILANKWE